ncbi:MAG: hypothetical protein WC393_00015 [Candidatus Nanoarchaeia archaeon]|jgi:hypothetical protein
MTDFTDLAKIVNVINNSHKFIIDLYSALKKQNEQELWALINEYKTNSNNKKLFEFDFVPTEAMKRMDDNCKAFPDNLNEFEKELGNIWLLMLNLQKMLSLNENNILIQTKSLFEQLITNYENSVKNLGKLRFDNKVEKLITNNNYKSVFKDFVEEINKKETFLQSIKLEANINGKAEKIDLNAIKTIIIFDKKYFIERQNEAMLLLGKNFLRHLIKIIKETAETDGTNKLQDNLLASLNDSNKYFAKAEELNIIIEDLKNSAMKIIHFSKKMNENELKYLKIEKNIDFNDYFNDANELLTKVMNLKSLDNDVGKAANLFDLSIFLIKNKKIEFFKKIKESEGKIMKSLTGIDLILNPDLTLEIDSLLNYTLVDMNTFKSLQNEQLNEKLIQDLKGFATMNNYVNLRCEYKTAKEKLENAITKWKSIINFNILDSKAIKEERMKELEIIATVLDDLKYFNKIFFEKINEYTNDFKTNFSKDKDKNQGVLTNEINKIRFYEDLLILLEKINDNRTKATQNRLKVLLQGKSGKISELNKYKSFIEEKTKNDYNIYKSVKEVQDIKEDFDNKDNFKMIKDAVESIGNYLKNMKDIGKIIEEFIIK